MRKCLFFVIPLLIGCSQNSLLQKEAQVQQQKKYIFMAENPTMKLDLGDNKKLLIHEVQNDDGFTNYHFTEVVYQTGLAPILPEVPIKFRTDQTTFYYYNHFKKAEASQIKPKTESWKLYQEVLDRASLTNLQPFHKIYQHRKYCVEKYADNSEGGIVLKVFHQDSPFKYLIAMITPDNVLNYTNTSVMFITLDREKLTLHRGKLPDSNQWLSQGDNIYVHKSSTGFVKPINIDQATAMFNDLDKLFVELTTKQSFSFFESKNDLNTLVAELGQLSARSFYEALPSID